jgi:hypothetical protein
MYDLLHLITNRVHLEGCEAEFLCIPRRILVSWVNLLRRNFIAFGSVRTFHMFFLKIDVRRFLSGYHYNTTFLFIN